MYIIVRGKKINKEQAYDIILDFDIKNIDDNNDKYCFLNWLDRNLGELYVRYNNSDKGVFMGNFKQIDWLY